jgi:Family of unknown function (DUF6203)
MPTECLGISLGVLGGTLVVLGFSWYIGRRRRRRRRNEDNNDKNPISKKSNNRELLDEHTLTN